MNKRSNEDKRDVGIGDAVQRNLLAKYVDPSRPETRILRRRDQTTIISMLGIGGGAEKINQKALKNLIKLYGKRGLKAEGRIFLIYNVCHTINQRLNPVVESKHLKDVDMLSVLCGHPIVLHPILSRL
jgi:hypothetical protein